MNKLGDRVSVLHIHDPHTFWIRSLEGREPGLPEICQGGLHGIRPCVPELVGDDWTYVSADTWSQAATAAFRDLVDSAQTVYFKGEYTRKDSWYEGLPYIFGTMTVKNKNETLIEVNLDLKNKRKGIFSDEVCYTISKISTADLYAVKKIIFPQSYSPVDYLSIKKATADDLRHKTRNSGVFNNEPSSPVSYQPKKPTETINERREFPRRNDEDGAFGYQNTPHSDQRRIHNQREETPPNRPRNNENRYSAQKNNSLQSNNERTRRSSYNDDDEKPTYGRHMQKARIEYTEDDKHSYNKSNNNSVHNRNTPQKNEPYKSRSDEKPNRISNPAENRNAYQANKRDSYERSTSVNDERPAENKNAYQSNKRNSYERFKSEFDEKPNKISHQSRDYERPAQTRNTYQGNKRDSYERSDSYKENKRPVENINVNLSKNESFDPEDIKPVEKLVQRPNDEKLEQIKIESVDRELEKPVEKTLNLIDFEFNDDEEEELVEVDFGILSIKEPEYDQENKQTETKTEDIEKKLTIENSENESEEVKIQKKEPENVGNDKKSTTELEIDVRCEKISESECENDIKELAIQDSGSDLEFDYEEEDSGQTSQFSSFLSDFGLGTVSPRISIPGIPMTSKLKEVSVRNILPIVKEIEKPVTKEIVPENAVSEKLDPEDQTPTKDILVHSNYDENTVPEISVPEKLEPENQSPTIDILVHSNYDEKILAWNNLSECAFMNVTLNNFEFLNYEFCSLYGNVWPSISKMRNSLVVGQNSLMALLVPLCDSVVGKTRSSIKKPIIVCSDENIAAEVRQICISLTKRTTIKISNQNELDCDIIIISFQKFDITSLKSLNNLNSVAFVSVNQFQKQFENYLYYILRNFPNIQILASSLSWCDWMSRAHHLLPNRSVFIENYMECVIYGKCLLDLHCSSEKIETLKTLLETNVTAGKTVVFCSDGQLEDIHDSWNKGNISYLRSDFRNDEMIQSKEKWNSKNSILVITDKAKAELPYQIFNANNLIHLSMSENFRIFSERFSVLLDNIPNLTMKNSVKENNVRVDIILDEDNCFSLPKIIDFAERCKVSIPENLAILSNYFNNYQEANIISQSIPICKELSLFGECSSQSYCYDRHRLYRDDCVPEYLISDDVRFQILSVQNPCQYLVRILEYKIDGVLKQHHENFLLIGLEMLKRGINTKNKKSIKKVIIGSVCLHVSGNCLERAEIYKIDEKNPNRIGVKFIDQGTSSFVFKFTLFDFPEKYASKNFTTMTVKLADAMPTDRISSDSLTKLSTDSFFRGSVVLGFNKTLYLNTFLRCAQLENCQSAVVLENIKVDLIRKKLIEENPNQIEKLKRLLKYFNLEQSIRVIKIKPRQNFKPQWAHLDDGINVATCPNVDENGHFFITLVKSEELITKLQAEIQTYVANFDKKITNSWNVGDFCIANFEDLYYRAKIIEVGDDDKIECFFVDYGDYDKVPSDKIYPITEELVFKLPFQAIECVLYGLRIPIKRDLIYDYLQGPEADNIFQLWVKYIEKTKATVTGGNRYAIGVKRKGDHYSVNRTFAINHVISVTGNLDSLVEFENTVIDTKKIEDEEDECWDFDNCEPFERVPEEPAELDEDLFDIEMEDEDIENLCRMMGLNPRPTIPKESTVEIVEIKDATVSETIETKSEKDESISENDFGFETINFAPDQKYTNMKKPKVTWYEDKTIIILTIKLNDMTSYTLNVDNQSVTFESEVDGEQYGFHLNLFGCVKSEHRHKHVGNCVKVGLEKVIQTEWHQLTVSKVKMSWIMYNFEHLEDKDISISTVLDTSGDTHFGNVDYSDYESNDSDGENDLCDNETEF